MSVPNGSVQTVLGEVPSASLGRTLIHEHLHIDLRPLAAEHGYGGGAKGSFDMCAAAEARWNPGAHSSNYDLTEIDLIADELGYLDDSGVGCVVDVTPVDLGRNPVALVELAARSGLHIVMGAGWYLEATHGRHVAGRSADQLTQQLVDECNHGVGDSTVKPGIIGEIGTNSPATRSELVVVAAAAAAGVETGRALSIHVHPWGHEGAHVLDAALAGGIDPTRVVLGHMNTAVSSPDYMRSLLDRGAHLAFDLFGFDHSLLGEGRYAPSDWDVVQGIGDLVREGYASQILLSQDVGVRTRLHRFGGWGYDHLTRHIVPLMHRLGVDSDAVDRMLTVNPQSLLTLRPPRR